MLGAQGLWAGRDLYRASPAVTRGLGFYGLIKRTAPFSRLFRHKGMWRTYSNPDLHGFFNFEVTQEMCCIFHNILRTIHFILFVLEFGLFNNFWLRLVALQIHFMTSTLYY
jgi:hypothetical protein